ncbi:hypothetical protein [Pedococcus sp. 5OH_020]|uniref:hypothetical protein n=1 Tax=Pedococcus sp. 5OH_020 TaxID=2989814 RepID=UPI0022E9C2A0|nr:hypothetical protein [Pedococcus sp. 5OH_020]
MSRKSDREGLSLGYRLGYRIRAIGMSIFGPAQLGEEDDPMRRLRREREAKVRAAREKREGRQ